MASSTPFSIFTTIRYDDTLHLLDKNTESFPIQSFPNSSSTASPDSGSSHLELDLDLETPNLYMAKLHRDRLLSAAKHFAPAFDSAIELLEKDGGREWARQVLSAVESQVRDKWQHRQDWTGAAKVRVQFSSEPQSGVKVTVFDLVEKLPTGLLFADEKVLGDPDRGDVPPPEHFKWDVYVDRNVGTEPSEFTSLKTTRREMYDAARARLMIKVEERKAGEKSNLQSFSLAPEVLLQSPAGLVLEGSISTPYFFRNGRWTTPPVDFGRGGQQGTTRRWAIAKGLCVEGDIPVSNIKEGEIIWLSNGAKGFGAGKVLFL